MNGTERQEMIGDEALTAYLDGELATGEHARVEAALMRDPGLRARLSALEAGGRPFEAAFVPLLKTAPVDRLETRLEALLPATSGTAGRRARDPRLAHPRLAIAAALLVAFLAGLVFERGIDTLAPDEPEVAVTGGWREAVASYLELYTSRSLALMDEDPQGLEDTLRGLSDTLGVPLSPASVGLDDASFRLAQLLEYEGKPLAQMIYLDRGDRPLAFCIIRNGRPDAAIATETRHGFNVVHWVRDGVGYMLIGRAPFESLEPRAEALASRI